MGKIKYSKEDRELEKIRKKMVHDHIHDPKDTEIYPEPETHHIIICKMCGETKRTRIGYMRTCGDCRRTPHYRLMKAHTEVWDTWAHDPHIGYTLEDIHGHIKNPKV